MLEDLLVQRVWRGMVRRLNNAAILRMARKIRTLAPTPGGAPVVFFKASTGIDDLSWNSGFHVLTSWALRLMGVPVVYVACRSGMSHCVLGTDRLRPHRAPPCRSCLHQARTLYDGADVVWFDYDADPALAAALQRLSVPELAAFEWAGALTNDARKDDSGADRDVHESTPLGELCLPSLRWILRIHHLADDEHTRYLFKEYIKSAWSLARRFDAFLGRIQPRAVVVFNGQFFPEAACRYVARQRGIRVITHEVGLQPASAFFTDGDATAYPMKIPESFELTESQNARLDNYLSRRFRGQFSMAGIKFWPRMRALDRGLLERLASFRQLVPVFTNVVFDTSQPHANVLFPSMFEWLRLVAEVVHAHPETLFVIRAHPDELRIRKASRETVAEWVRASGIERESNVLYVGPNEALSSYELIQRSKFVMVYNSTIGLEASILGVPVLCGGKARYTSYRTVFFPSSAEQLRSMLEEFLASDVIDVPEDFRVNARRVLYYQLFRTSLEFDEFLRPSVRPTQARLRPFHPRRLSSSGSPAIRAILHGILNDGDFTLPETSAEREAALPDTGVHQ